MTIPYKPSREPSPVTKSAVHPGARRALGPGFTLTELLVALTLSSVVLGSVVAFFMSQVRSSRLGHTRIEAVQRARFATELLRREVGLAGSGMPNVQPLVVYAGPDDFVFSADLASSTPGDRVAVYHLPGAPTSETEGADSGAVVLPNGAVHPQRWYGSGNQGGPAETVRLSFAPGPDGRYVLTRTVNDRSPEILLRGITAIPGQEFFRYEAQDADGELRDVGSGPFWHEAAIHGSAADTGASALTDSLKVVHIAFDMNVRARQPEDTVQRTFVLAVGLKNAGLVRNQACGESPVLGTSPTGTVVSLDPPTVQVSWSPAMDERSGEADVIQYTLYRQELGEATPRPVASIPPNPAVASYTYTDTDIELDGTYTYYLGATDCTPVQSALSSSPPVTVE